MIISERIDQDQQEFEQLLALACEDIERQAEYKASYFSKRSATQFEKDVYDALCKLAKDSVFEGSIELVSGFRFPDITVKSFYGIEVKTIQQNTWKSTGNSVLESKGLIMWAGFIFSLLNFSLN
ncbi:MAG: hypothetical protein R2880_10425 [Deinococcales bacterium]